MRKRTIYIDRKKIVLVSFASYTIDFKMFTFAYYEA